MEDAQGVMRGGCRECSCRRYVLPMVNRCDYCNHLPIAHQELQPAPVAAPSSSSSSTKLATSPRTKHLFQQQAPPSPAQQVSKPHRNGGNTSSSSLASDPLESASTAAAAASLLAYVEAQLHKRNGTTPSLLPPQDPPPAATVLASQSSVDELLALLRAHLAGAPPSSTATATTADAATSPTPHTTTSSPQPSATFSSTTSSGTSPVHTSSPASASSSTTPATPAASAGLGLLPTPLFPASPALAPPPTPPPQSSSALAAAAEANGVDCTAAPAVSAAGRRKKPAITAAAVVAAATKAVTVAATPATPAAAAADGQLNAKKNRARKRGARARSRSKVGGGLELPHAADASSTNSNGHPGDEEDDEAEAEAAFDDDHERDELDAEYADEPGLASTSHHHQQQQPQPHEAHSIPDEAAQSATTAMTGGQQQPEPFVRRNTGGRRRPQQEKVEELIPLSFLTNALFTPPPPQPQPSADVPAPVETKRVKGVGTGDPKFSITITKCVNKTLMFHTISAMPEYCGKSFEELRWEDYQLGNRGTQTRPSLFSLIDTSSPPYPLPSPATTVAFDRAPSPPPASLLPRSLQGFFDSAVAATDADADAQPPLDLLPPPPMPVACGHSARDEADADGGEEEERIIYRTPSKPLLDDKPASAPSPLVLTSSTSAPPAPHKEVDAAQLAPGSRLRARNAANRTRVTRLYEELYELVEQLGRQVAAAGDDGDTTTPAPLFEADALLHRIHAATRDYAFAPTAPAASVFTSGTPLSPPLFALPPPPHSPYSPLASASAAAAAAMGAPSPAPSPSPGFSALSPAPSAPVYTAFPPPASSPFALRSFPVPMDLSYFKRYYIKGSYVPFLEDFAHEFKDVARNKKEHYFAIINHPKLEANLSAFLNSRDGGTLYFGIHDSGQVIGVSITRDQLDSLKNMIWAKMETFNPVPDPHLYRIEIVPVCNARATALIKDLYVVEIHITGGTRLYFNREDRAWVRRDAGNHCLKSGAEVRDFIEQRGKERRQERRGEKRRSDHHDSPASSSSSSSSTSMDTNLDDGGGLTMRPLTPRAHSGSGSGIRGTLESGGVGAATTTTPGPASSASAALQPSPVPLLFPLRRPVHRDGRVAPVWLKTWSGTGPADGSQQATAAEAANPGDRRAAGEVTATASKKPKRATTPDNAVVDAVIYNAEAETEVGRSVTDATANICRHDGERGGEAEVEQGGEADHVQVAAAPDTAEKMTAAAPVGDEGLLDHRPVGVTNVETTDKREEVAKEENEVRSHTAQEAENCEQKMRDLEADLARLSADTSELVSLSWIPTPEAAATSTAAAASSDETMTHAASPDFLKEATAPASELKERPASPAAAVGDDATTANTNTEDGTDAEVALAAGGDVPSAAALVVVDDNDHQGQSGQRKTDVVAEEEDPDGHGEVEEEVKADEAILAFGPTLGVTSDGMRGASTAPAAATGALPPFSFADFSSSFFSSFSLPSSLYSPSPSTYSPAPLSATNTTAAPTSSSSSSSSPPSSPSPSASPALRSSTKRSLAAFLPSVGAKAGRMASPSLLPLPAAAAPLDATPTPGVDRGSTATATAAAADSEEKKVGKNRRKKEQRMLKSNGNRPAISTADTDEVRPTKTDHADGSADESESEGKTEENETEKEKEEKEKTMEAELEKLERELEADRRQFVAQFASCFADLAIGGASREADADDEAKAERVATSS